MEIERKFLVSVLPDLSAYEYHIIEQAYLCINPVIRIRRQDDEYYLTYKSSGLMIREESNLPLTKAAYLHLLPKADGNIIRKKRYLIPAPDGLLIELDIFDPPFDQLIIAEVEFRTARQAGEYLPPEWFGREVTQDPQYQNSSLSSLEF